MKQKLANTLFELALCFKQTQHYDDAFDVLKECVDLKREIYSNEHTATIEIKNYLG